MAAAALAYYKLPVAAGAALIISALSAVGYFTAGYFALKFPNGGIKYEVWKTKRTVRNGYVYVERIRNAKHVRAF